MILRRLLLLSLVLYCWGCASEGWDALPIARELPYVWKVATAAQLQGKCPSEPGLLTSGCAVRDWDVKLCFIYAEDAEDSSPAWIKDHEKKHCRGYNHPKQYAMPEVRFR